VISIENRTFSHLGCIWRPRWRGSLGIG